MREYFYVYTVYIQSAENRQKNESLSKINVQKLFNIWLQSGINLITYLLYPKRLINKSINKIKARGGGHISPKRKNRNTKFY